MAAAAGLLGGGSAAGGAGAAGAGAGSTGAGAGLGSMMGGMLGGGEAKGMAGGKKTGTDPMGVTPEGFDFHQNLVGGLSKMGSEGDAILQYLSGGKAGNAAPAPLPQYQRAPENSGGSAADAMLAKLSSIDSGAMKNNAKANNQYGVTLF